MRLRSAAGVLLEDMVIAGEGEPGLDAVERLSRLRLVAQRQGCSVEAYEICDRLTELLQLAGLLELLG